MIRSDSFPVGLIDHILLTHTVLAAKAHACVQHKHAHTQKDTELWSFQSTDFVSAARLNMSTRSVEHTVVSQ